MMPEFSNSTEAASLIAMLKADGWRVWDVPTAPQDTKLQKWAWIPYRVLVTVTVHPAAALDDDEGEERFTVEVHDTFDTYIRRRTDDPTVVVRLVEQACAVMGIALGWMGYGSDAPPKETP